MKALFFAFLSTLCLISCFHMKNQIAKHLAPPVAKETPKELIKHGDVRQDPYFWMSERDSKPVLDYIDAENKFTEKVLSKTKNIASHLFKEMKSRVKEDDSTPPYKHGPYYYYVRYEKNKEYPIYCRRRDNLNSPEEIILDVNVLAKGKSYYAAHMIDISPDHNLLAFAVDEVGRRFYTIYFKDLKQDIILKRHIPDTTGQWVWFNDNKTGYYTQQDKQTLRSHRVYKTTLDNEKSTLVVEEKDELFSLGIKKSLNEKTVFITTSSFDSSQVSYISADRPHKTPLIFLKKQKHHLYKLEDGDDAFFILSNNSGENFQIYSTKKSQPERKHWTTFVEHRKTFLIEDMLVLKNYVVVEGRQNGLNQIEVVHRKNKKKQRIVFKDETYVASLSTNAEYDSQIVRYSYSSLITPVTIFDYSIDKNSSVIIKETEVPTYNAKLYETKRVWAKAKDGTRVPVSLVYKKSLFKKGQNPLFQYGYGSYGISMQPNFRLTIISLLDRGFIFAIAHIRGGQELGRHWYEDGRLKKKEKYFF